MAHLENHGELLRIDREVSLVHEIAAYVRKSSDIGGPAFLFENVTGYKGWTVAGGVYAKRDRISRALATKIDEVVHRYVRGISTPIPPKIVETSARNDVVWEGNQVDLSKLPIVTHSARDAGGFITAGVQVAKNPATQTRALGIHRMQIKGRNRLGLLIPATKRFGRALETAESMDIPLEIATAIGVDPYTMLASVARVPHALDKYDIAGGIKGAPISLVKCKTIDIEVPLGSEIVIEGEILPGIRETEGPFGEVEGCYSGQSNSPVVQVKRITMREDPIYLTALTGLPETDNHVMKWPSTCETAYRAATSSYSNPDVRSVNLINGWLVIAIKKRHSGEPSNVLHSVLSSISEKYCLVVDDDVNIYDPCEIEWVFRTRVQPAENVQIFPRMQGTTLDPSSPSVRLTSKLGIDGTLPVGADRLKFEKVTVPGSESVSW